MKKLGSPAAAWVMVPAGDPTEKTVMALADKMKCLIQRRYAYDLFDLVYGVFVNRELDLDRSELVQTFLGEEPA